MNPEIQPWLLFESKRGKTHGTLRRSQGGRGKTFCGLKMLDGWGYRGEGIPTCAHCKELWLRPSPLR